MNLDIYKRLELKNIDCSKEQLDLALIIEKNPYMDIVEICNSLKYPGEFIVATVNISIPTKGVYKGLDIREKETIVFYIPINYPLAAPSVIPARKDFPTNKIPHLNTGISGTEIKELNLCLYRGNVDEWFFQVGPQAFCDKVVRWFSDLVNGELIYNDGFENVRITDQRDCLFMDYKAITSFIKTSKENQGFEIFCIENEKYCKKLLVDKYDYEKSRDTYTPCIFAYDRIMSESDYIVNDFKIFSDVEIFNSSGQVKKGLKKYRAHMLKYVGVKKIPKLITVVLAIKRPMQVLGTFDKFDYIAFLLDFDFESNPDELGKCNISNLSTMGMVTKELAEKISGTEFDKTGITIIGVGAVGSKISMHLSRMGYINQTIYDNDCLLPHNLVRHEEKYPGMVGMPKALIAKLNIDLLFRNESKCIDGYKDILKHDIELDDEIIVDATASERCLNLLCSKKNIKGILVRTEVFADGNVGATFVEGNKKNPDIYDLRVSLWNKARKNVKMKE